VSVAESIQEKFLGSNPQITSRRQAPHCNYTSSTLIPEPPDTSPDPWDRFIVPIEGCRSRNGRRDGVERNASCRTAGLLVDRLGKQTLDMASLREIK
jgi:hypothetical protein